MARTDWVTLARPACEFRQMKQRIPALSQGDQGSRIRRNFQRYQ